MDPFLGKYEQQIIKQPANMKIDKDMGVGQVELSRGVLVARLLGASIFG